MTPDQTALALYSCRTCGCALDYQGVGRPPVYCAEHRPGSFPPLQGVRGSHQLNGGVSVEPRARLSDPETSHAAARSLRLSADNDRGLALLALVDGGPCHDFDLAARVGKKQTSIGVRRKELVSLGLAERAPVKPRPNADGSLCVVWCATPEGIARARELRDNA